jgi:Xaa-Pro aminopeptidase
MRLRETLQQKDLDALLVSSPDSIGYLTGFFNFAHAEREAFVLVTLKNTYLFTDSRFSGMMENLPTDVTFVEAGAHTPAFELIKDLAARESVKQIGFDQANLTVQEFVTIKKILRQTAKLKVSGDLVLTQRIIKDEQELKYLKKACELTDGAFRYVLPFIRLEVTEKQLAERITNFFKRNDADNAFPPIVAFGKNAAVPHHLTGNKKLEESDHYILFDFGAQYQNYCADMSRTVFVGKLSNTIKKQYQIVVSSQKKALSALKIANRTSKTIDLAARTYLKEHSFELPHALGHGVGIAVHEQPVLSPRTESNIDVGMVLAIEPGIYIPGVGGIRIEDTVIVTSNGYLSLTKAPREMIILN